MKRAHNFIDLTGQRFGRLVVQRLAQGGEHSRWECQCDCGKTKSVPGNNMRRGQTKSCGCVRAEFQATGFADKTRTHGKTKTPEYKIWADMRGRCASPGKTSYKRYGARGITVCDRWTDFLAFLADMGPRPSADHSIDRIDPTGNYSPENCRWATLEQQANNKTDNTYVEMDGERIALTLAMRKKPPLVSGATVRRRLHKGWPINDAFFKPPAKNGFC